jgi:hypothetical protein
MKIKKWLILSAICFVCIAFSSCIYMPTHIRSMNTARVQQSKTLTMKRIAKMHLTDGSVVIFEKGFEYQNGVFTGSGMQYDLTRENSHAVSEISIESVKSITYYERKLQPFPLIFSTLNLLFVFIYVSQALDRQ